MEQEKTPVEIKLGGEVFSVVKPSRLNYGVVLHDASRDVYARLGEKQATIEEQMHTVALYNRGFPVARVLDSGVYDNDQWYFTEESLGTDTFHVRFAHEYAETGQVSDETFTEFLEVIARYTAAQCAPANHMTITAQDFFESAFPEHEVLNNYTLLGGDADRYRQAMQKAIAHLENVPMGVLQFDLNPYNVLERGVIDFEMVGYGPIGYDTYFVSRWHRWFTSDQTSRYRMQYALTGDQIAACDDYITREAEKNNLPNPLDHAQEFILIKSAWGFSSHNNFYDEPESKQAFYRYRAEILTQCIDSYLADTPIDPLTFPDVRASHS